MLWLTWRQHRREALVFGVVFAAIATYLIVTGRIMYAAYNQMTDGVSVAICQQRHQPSAFCSSISSAFDTKYGNEQLPLAALILLPPLAGMFLGAPLVARELESGTFRLAWTQGVTRLRWLLTNVAAQVAIALLIAAALIPLFAWWRGPFLPNDASIGSESYAVGGILPLAYMTFALALGIAAGTLLRRTIPAMFATLAGYVAVTLALANWGRPNFLPPVIETWDPSLVNGPTTLTGNAWILYSGYVDKSGHRIDMPTTAYSTCASNGIVDFTVGSPYNACIHAHGWLSTMVWQPASRYWLFQGIESSILVALALLLLTLTVWWVQRRLS